MDKLNPADFGMGSVELPDVIVSVRNTSLWIEPSSQSNAVIHFAIAHLPAPLHELTAAQDPRRKSAQTLTDRTMRRSLGRIH